MLLSAIRFSTRRAGMFGRPGNVYFTPHSLGSKWRPQHGCCPPTPPSQSYRAYQRRVSLEKARRCGGFCVKRSRNLRVPHGVFVFL